MPTVYLVVNFCYAEIRMDASFLYAQARFLYVAICEVAKVMAKSTGNAKNLHLIQSNLIVIVNRWKLLH